MIGLLYFEKVLSLIQIMLSADAVQIIMRDHLKPGSYRAWRKRVHDFGTRRQHYK